MAVNKEHKQNKAQISVRVTLCTHNTILLVLFLDKYATKQPRTLPSKSKLFIDDRASRWAIIDFILRDRTQGEC